MFSVTQNIAFCLTQEGNLLNCACLLSLHFFDLVFYFSVIVETKEDEMMMTARIEARTPKNPKR